MQAVQEMAFVLQIQVAVLPYADVTDFGLVHVVMYEFPADFGEILIWRLSMVKFILLAVCFSVTKWFRCNEIYRFMWLLRQVKMLKLLI